MCDAETAHKPYSVQEPQKMIIDLMTETKF
jgi:hypothetical protein